MLNLVSQFGLYHKLIYICSRFRAVIASIALFSTNFGLYHKPIYKHLLNLIEFKPEEFRNH